MNLKLTLTKGNYHEFYSTKKGKRYSNEFRTEAVELARNIGITKACEDLGISQARALQGGAWSSSGVSGSSKSISELEKENRRLHKENGYLRKITDVLKKSKAIFSADQIHGSK